MIDLEHLYFEWLLTCLNPEGAREEVAYVGGLLHMFSFDRRVGNDINRAVDGANLRKDFMSQFEDADFDPHVTNDLLMQECSWFEMMIALAKAIDYTYDGGVEERFMELVDNMGLSTVMVYDPNRTDLVTEFDEHLVERATHRIDINLITESGHGGMFPLHKQDHLDQREVEIWDQQGAYFRERLEGVLWTSTS